MCDPYSLRLTSKLRIARACPIPVLEFTIWPTSSFFDLVDASLMSTKYLKSGLLAHQPFKYLVSLSFPLVLFPISCNFQKSDKGK